MSDSSGPHGLEPIRLLCPWDFPGKSTGVGCHCLLRATPNDSDSIALGPGSESYSNQNSMLLEQKQTYNSTEHNREPGSKPTFIWSISLQQKWQEYTMGERQKQSNNER